MERRILTVIITITLLMTTAVPGFAALKISPERTTVVNSLPEVILYMDTDETYKATKENTQVFVNDEKTDIQEIKKFKKTGEGITYYILVDLSKSITEEDFEVIKTGINSFAGMLSDEDMILLIPFGETLYADDTMYKPSDEEFKKAVDSLELNDDYTQLYNAIDFTREKALNDKESSLPDRNIAMVFTDGADETTGGYIDDSEISNKMSSAGIPLYGFTVGTDSKGKDRLGSICRALNGNLTDINGENVNTTMSSFKNVMDETLVIKTNVRNSESIGLDFAVRVQVNGEQILLKEGIKANKSDASRDLFSVAMKKIILEYWWIIVIFSIALIALIVLLVIRRNKGIVTVEGQVVYRSKLQEKIHIKVREYNSRNVRLNVSVNGGSNIIQEVTIVQSIIVGRSSECDVYFDDATMSRQHFSIEIENSELYINDCDSTGGTYLNGVRVYMKQRLNRGDIVTAGRTEIKVDWD